MAFDGTEGEQITLAEGAALTANYRSADPNGRLGHFMGKDIISDILAQSGCMGIRIYQGIDSTGKRQLVLVGTDANENDMISTTHIIADKGTPCPSFCGTSNDLNS